MISRLLHGLFLLALAVLAGCARDAGPPTAATVRPVLTKVRFQTDWHPQAEHGGFYQALAKGYYAEVGLDVDILAGGPGANIKPRVALGEIELGMNRSDDILVAVDHGLPLVMAGAFLQHDHLGLLLHADDPARSFADLNGRTVTAMVGLTWIPFVEKRYGIKLNLRPDSTGLATFLADPAEIHQCLVTSEPFYATQQNVPVRTLAIAESGYDCYHVIITSRAFLRDHPATVRAFVAASLRGWDDYIRGDPAPAHAEIIRRNPEMAPALLAYSRGELIKRGSVQGDAAKGESLGQLKRLRLEQQLAILREFGVVEKLTAIDEAVDAAALTK